MPLICRVRPNRRFPRTFKARDVGRIACAAVENGVSPQEIRIELRDCVPCAEDEDSRRILNEALAALQQSQSIIGVVVTLVSAIAAALVGVQLVGRFVPQARLALLVLRPAITRVEGFLGTIIARQAANDAVIAVLRRAA